MSEEDATGGSTARHVGSHYVVDEREILMSVDDDSAVRVTDMVTESSTFAIVMELVDGSDLGSRTGPDHLSPPVPPNRPSNFSVSAQDPRAGKSHPFFCHVVGEYVDCSSQDHEVYLIIPR